MINSQSMFDFWSSNDFFALGQISIIPLVNLIYWNLLENKWAVKIFYLFYWLAMDV